jgi:hypothetical protein
MAGKNVLKNQLCKKLVDNTVKSFIFHQICIPLNLKVRSNIQQ